MTSTFGASPFLAELCALAHAEAVLLVGDHQPEAAIFHAIGDQRVRADDHVPRAAADRFVRQAVLFGGQAAGQQPHAQPHWLEQRPRAVVVLPREHLGRRHHRRLITAAARQPNCRKGNRRLAAAQRRPARAAPSPRRAQVCGDLRQHAPLRAGGRKGQARPERLDRRVVELQPHALRAPNRASAPARPDTTANPRTPAAAARRRAPHGWRESERCAARSCARSGRSAGEWIPAGPRASSRRKPPVPPRSPRAAPSAVRPVPAGRRESAPLRARWSD